MDKWICKINEIQKSYGSELILGPISLTLMPGEIVGIQGSNGAGKSTLLKVCAGLLRPEHGTVDLGPGVKEAVGYVPQDIALYPSLSGYDNMAYWAELQGLTGREKKEIIENLLCKVGLQDKARKRVETYSGGMKRRLNLAASLLRRQKLLLLDEVTAGADAESTKQILTCVEEAARQGCGVLMVTHRQDELAICHRILTLEQGKITESI